MILLKVNWNSLYPSIPSPSLPDSPYHRTKLKCPNGTDDRTLIYLPSVPIFVVLVNPLGTGYIHILLSPNLFLLSYVRHSSLLRPIQDFPLSCPKQLSTPIHTFLSPVRIENSKTDLSTFLSRHS